MYALFFLHQPNLYLPPPDSPLLLSPSSIVFFFSLTDPNDQQVMSGEVHDRLIPIPYSKTSTDQAVRECETQRQHSTLLRSPTVLLLCSLLSWHSVSYRIIVSLDRSFFVAVAWLLV